MSLDVIKLTIGIIVAVTVALVGYDIWVATNAIDNSLDTLSGRMRIWSMATPVIPWVWCGLAGHFFGPFSPGQFFPAKTGIALLVFSTWTLLVIGLYCRTEGIQIPPWSVCVPAFLAGAIFWAQ